jgi:hypothetical protein
MDSDDEMEDDEDEDEESSDEPEPEPVKPGGWWLLCRLLHMMQGSAACAGCTYGFCCCSGCAVRTGDMLCSSAQ